MSSMFMKINDETFTQFFLVFPKFTDMLFNKYFI